MTQFFISYSRSVKEEIRQVIELLDASGHDVWWDADIPIMADWWATILDRIEWCDVLIFVASKRSVESTYCLTELRYARDRQRPIIPFILDHPDDMDLPSELPARGQWLIYTGDPAQILKQINLAIDTINWERHQDIDVRRPPEPGPCQAVSGGVAAGQ